MDKLKHKEIKDYRERQLKKQKGLCALCKREVRLDQATLDHCHSSGHVRKVLHRNCNSVEGRILHWARRSGYPPDEFLRALLRYWRQDYSKNPIHPTHGKPKRRKRRRKK